MKNNESHIRSFADLDFWVDFPFTFRPAHQFLASQRPEVILAESLARAEKEMDTALGELRPVLACVSAPDDGSMESFAHRVENVLVAARMASHFAGGRTVNLRAIGGAIPAAEKAFQLERGFFGTLEKVVS